MQTQAELFLQILEFMGPEGYYARTSKEKQILTALEEKKLALKKKGTKQVYIINASKPNPSTMDLTTFLQELKRYFFEFQTLQQPFVSIGELRETFKSIGVDEALFNKYIAELYEDHTIELEKSFTVKDGELTGLNYKNKKYFTYILSVD